MVEEWGNQTVLFHKLLVKTWIVMQTDNCGGDLVSESLYMYRILPLPSAPKTGKGTNWLYFFYKI